MSLISILTKWIIFQVVLIVICFFTALLVLPIIMTDIIMTDIIMTDFIMTNLIYFAITVYIAGCIGNVIQNSQKPSYMPFATPTIERYLYKKVGNWTFLLLKILSFVILLATTFVLATSLDYPITDALVILFGISWIFFMCLIINNAMIRRSNFKIFTSSENIQCRICAKTLDGHAVCLEWINKWYRVANVVKTYSHYECFINSKPSNII